MSESTNLPAKNGRDIKSFLESQRDRIAAVCDKLVTPDKVIQVAAIVAYRTPELANCDPASVLASVIQAASLGLDLHPSSGEAYLIPYAGVCTFQAGYQGLCKLARQAGTHYIAARLVYEADEFSWEFSPELVMRHVPCRDGNLGKLLGAYAVARVASGELVGEYMPVSEIEYIRSKSKQKNGFGWKDWYGEMCRKTPCRRLCKWLPKSPKLIEALASIDQDYQPDDSPEGQPEAIPGATKTDRLTAVIAKRAEALSTNGSTNGHKPPESPEPPAVVAQVEQPAQPDAQAVITTPRTGYELEQVATVEGTLGWFQHYGAEKAFRAKVSQWSANQVRTAWDAYQTEGL